MSKSRCRRCLLQEAFPADYEKYIASLLRQIAPQQRSAQGVYGARLDICRACDQLNNGTCMGCGCLVELRAAYRRERCPFQKWPTQE